MPAPWSLHGDAYLLPTIKAKAIKQHDVNPLLGANDWALLGAVLLVRYHDTSVGPYSELIFATGLHRVGTRLGFHISQIYVDSAASKDGGQSNWAVPKQLAIFDWQQKDNWTEVAMRLPDSASAFLSAKFSASRKGIPVSSAFVPPPIKTILQFCDPETRPSHNLATRVSAAGRLHALRDVSMISDGVKVPSDKSLGIWPIGISLADFRGTFASTLTLHPQNKKK